MRPIEVLTSVTGVTIEFGVMMVFGLVNAIYNAFFGKSGSDRGDDES